MRVGVIAGGEREICMYIGYITSCEIDMFEGGDSEICMCIYARE